MTRQCGVSVAPIVDIVQGLGAPPKPKPDFEEKFTITMSYANISNTAALTATER
jgi:hypothetical protein